MLIEGKVCVDYIRTYVAIPPPKKYFEFYVIAEWGMLIDVF